MRIGIDARMYSAKFTGIGRYNYELISHVTRMAPQHTFVVFLNEPEYTSFVPEAPNVEKVLVNAKHYSLGEQTRFLMALTRAKLDLMHFTHFNSPILYFGKQVVTIHDLTLSFFPGKKMTALPFRLAYNLSIWSVCKKSRRIITISKNTEKDIKHILHMPASKIDVIYEGASQVFSKHPSKDSIHATKKHYGITQPYFLYAGVWRSHKNVVGLLHAFAKVRTEHHINAELVITGRQDATYHEIPETIDTLGLRDHVKLVGLVSEEELGILFAGARAYVFPSFYEGFGLPALEAFAAGIPVAASNTSCLPEICGEQNAVFFDPYDHNDMAKNMALVYSDDTLRHTLIANGKERLRAFSWETMGQETLAVYEKALRS